VRTAAMRYETVHEGERSCLGQSGIGITSDSPHR
jgi:hypothetical protein